MLLFPVSLILSLLLQVHLGPCSVSAKRVGRPHKTFSHLATNATDEDDNIMNQADLRYMTTLTVAGTTVNVMLDTGSTDMWVAPPNGFNGSFDDTSAYAAIYYGDGTNFVNGSVGLGLVQIAGYSIPNQAFINVTNSAEEESDFASGMYGLVGLGFDGPNGSIPLALTDAGYNGTTVGQSVLSSIFLQNPDLGRFYAFSLSRIDDASDTADASLTIGEYDPKYAAVGDYPALPQYPFDSGAWTIITEGISVDGQNITGWNSSYDLPDGQSTVLLDTGTPNIFLPAEIRDAVYMAVPGAVVSRNSSLPSANGFDDDSWVIPCTAAVNMTLYFAGLEYPIHPLDLVDLTVVTGPDGNNYTVCTGSVGSSGDTLDGCCDGLYGDSFLRNVYSSFSFGDDTTGAYIQLLPDTDTDAAAADYLAHRAASLQNGPPELAPADIIEIFDGANATTTAAPTPTSTSDGSTAGIATATAPDTIQTNDGTNSGFGAAAAATAQCTPAIDPSVDLADNSSSSSSTDSKYGPVIVGLLAANLVLLLVLAAFSVMNFVRGGRKAGPTRGANASYAPVRVKEDVRSSLDFEHVSGRYSD